MKKTEELLSLILLTLYFIFCAILITSYYGTHNEESFKKNGHDYIRFGYVVVHDPDCKKCFDLYD